jgi:hypothetical protein
LGASQSPDRSSPTVSSVAPLFRYDGSTIIPCNGDLIRGSLAFAGFSKCANWQTSSSKPEFWLPSKARIFVKLISIIASSKPFKSSRGFVKFKL